MWAMIFASVYSFQFHPGKPVKERMTYAEIALLCDRACEFYNLRFEAKE